MIQERESLFTPHSTQQGNTGQLPEDYQAVEGGVPG